MTPAPSRLGLVQVHGATVLFGLAGLFGKLLHASPLVIVLGRTVAASLALALAARALGASLRVPARDAGVLAGAGAILAFHWFAFFHAIQLSTVAIGVLGFATFPLFVTFLEPVFFDERLRGRDVAIAALAVVGLALTVPALDATSDAARGLAWAVLSAVSFAALSLVLRASARKHPPLVVALYQNAFAGLATLPLAYEGAAQLTRDEVLRLLVLGVLCTALAQTLYVSSLRHVRAQVASVIVSLEPVYGIALARVVLGEVVGFRTVAGGALVLAAALGTTLRAREVDS